MESPLPAGQGQPGPAWQEPAQPEPPRGEPLQNQPPFPGQTEQQAPPAVKEQRSQPGARGAPGSRTVPRGGGGQPAGRPQAGAGRLGSIGVEEVLETQVVTAERDTPIATVVAEMAEKNVGSVVIVEGDSPIGVVTDRRIALALETTPDVSERRAEDLLTDEFVSGSTEMSALDVLHRLSEAGIRRLPIEDEEGALAGIVTVDDILLLFSEELQNVADIIRTQSPRL